ncbi:pilin [Parasalinivibrio latis]|uniref:pilin n=1 Tax=Parasalinivibrio latis TaxID=2952610 RepID=UPI0030E52F3D
MKKQQGFSLIELMIVVAVIGVLSAIAIPAYQDYVKKSEAAAGLATLRSLQTNIDLYQQEKGSFPAAVTDVGGNTDMTNLGSITLAATASGGTATFAFNANTSINTKTIVYTKSNSNGWSCANNTGVPLDACK